MFSLVTLRSLVVACALALSSSALATAPSAQASAPTIALLVSAPGELADVERDARAALPSDAVLSPARTVALLEKARGFGVPCAVLDEACAAGFGALVGVADVIVVTAERIAGVPVVKVARVDMKGAPTVRVGGRMTERAGDGGATVAALIAALDAPVAARGSATIPVRVAVDPPDAVIVVDGAPLQRVDGVAWLLPGAHVFEARANGGRATTTLDLASDGRVVDVSLAVSPGPAPTPPSTPTMTPAAPIAEPEGSPLPTVAVVVGALLGIGGAALWIGADQALAAVMPPDDRATISVVGISGAALVVGGAGAAVVGSWVLLSP